MAGRPTRKGRSGRKDAGSRQVAKRAPRSSRKAKAKVKVAAAKVPRKARAATAPALTPRPQPYEPLPGKRGRLLQQALSVGLGSRLAMAAGVEHVAAAEQSLALVVKLPTMPPRAGEPWPAYRARIGDALSVVQRRIEAEFRIAPTPLIAANALAVRLGPDQIGTVEAMAEVARIELDPVVDAALMNDVGADIGLPQLRVRRAGLDGRDVAVAVLDSGVDIRHPFLAVASSFTTCGEPVELPGAHGTHCAGSVASRDTDYPGVAPQARLLNVKVLTGATGSGTHTGIVRGIDVAIDAGADILSMSLGFNHLPTWSWGGHGWMCDNGHCPLCTAVDNASALDNKLVVVAAGNEHQKAQALRAAGQGDRFDAEICCPGQAREALTVGAVTKQARAPAQFSSRGPTAYGMTKPDLAAPGVNITSTVPVPRDASGTPLPDPPRSALFGRNSGTSMATPIVAGAAALVVQHLRQTAGAWTPTQVKQILLGKLRGLQHPAGEVGGGELDMSRI